MTAAPLKVLEPVRHAHGKILGVIHNSQESHEHDEDNKQRHYDRHDTLGYELKFPKADPKSIAHDKVLH